jgi:DNA-directed RNA polymerase subunit D
MEVKKVSGDEKELCFLIKGINNVIANTLRRAMMVEVPTLAIDEINFLKNDSALYDEIIAHRLGLVPLVTDLKSYDLKESCSCKGKGCAKCQLNFILKVKGPCTVYSSDLQSQDPKIKPVYDKMPITILLKGQKLELEATAILGKGRDHSKFSPGLVYYKAFPEVKIDPNKCKKCGRCVEACPKKIIKKEGDKVKVTDIYECHLCKACEDVCPNKAIKVNDSKTDFIFYVESFGQLKASDVFKESLNVFNSKLDEFAKKLKAAKLVETKLDKIKKGVKTVAKKSVKKVKK